MGGFIQFGLGLGTGLRALIQLLGVEWVTKNRFFPILPPMGQ